MKAIIFNYSRETLQFIAIYPVADNASQPCTCEEREAVSPRPLGSNEQLEIVEDVVAEFYIKDMEARGFVEDTGSHPWQARTSYRQWDSPKYLKVQGAIPGAEYELRA
jgi:hypothetical protein